MQWHLNNWDVKSHLTSTVYYLYHLHRKYRSSNPGLQHAPFFAQKNKYKNITIISTAEIQIYTLIITGGGRRLNSSPPPPTPIRRGFCQKFLPYVFAYLIMPQKYVVNSVQISLKIHFLFFHLSYRHEKEYNHFFCSLL